MGAKILCPANLDKEDLACTDSTELLSIILALSLKPLKNFLLVYIYGTSGSIYTFTLHISIIWAKVKIYP